jgi:hypothetical protein
MAAVSAERFPMAGAQPFGEAAAAMGAVGCLDVKIGGDGKCASVKEFVILQPVTGRPPFIGKDLTGRPPVPQCQLLNL